MKFEIQISAENDARRRTFFSRSISKLQLINNSSFAFKRLFTLEIGAWEEH
jgi:hypothetical protein